MHSLFTVVDSVTPSYRILTIDLSAIAVNQPSSNKINTPTTESLMQCGKRDFGRRRRPRTIIIFSPLQSYHTTHGTGVIYLRLLSSLWYSMVPSPALMHEGRNPSMRSVFAAFSWISSFVLNAPCLFYSLCVFFRSRDLCVLRRILFKLFKIVDTLLITVLSIWDPIKLNCCEFVDELFRSTHWIHP